MDCIVSMLLKSICRQWSVRPTQLLQLDFKHVVGPRYNAPGQPCLYVNFSRRLVRAFVLVHYDMMRCQ